MTLVLTFLSLMSAYWWKNYILNFKRLISLTLRDTLKRTPKVISNQNLFSRFQSWCWSWCLNFVSKNQAILLALKILGLQGFSLQPGWVSTPLISQKVTKSLLTPLSPPNFYIIITWSWRLKNKNKNGYKYFKQQNKLIFLGNLYQIFCLWCTFL